MLHLIVTSLQDGFVDEADLNAHINVITSRNKYPLDAIMQLKELYRKAWKRVRRAAPRVLVCPLSAHCPQPTPRMPL